MFLKHSCLKKKIEKAAVCLLKFHILSWLWGFFKDYRKFPVYSLALLDMKQSSQGTEGLKPQKGAQLNSYWLASCIKQLLI